MKNKLYVAAIYEIETKESKPHHLYQEFYVYETEEYAIRNVASILYNSFFSKFFPYQKDYSVVGNLLDNKKYQEIIDLFNTAVKWKVDIYPLNISSH